MKILTNDQLIAIYYFIIFTAFIFLLFGKKNFLTFLCFSLLIIIILLYSKKILAMFQVTNEPFKKTPYTEYDCNNFTEISNPSSKTFISYSQKLAGKCNPKMNMVPIVVSPAMDLEVWKANDFVVHSHINDSSPFFDDLSGYTVQPIGKSEVRENYCGGNSGAVRAPVPVVTGANGQYVPMCRGNEVRENYSDAEYSGCGGNRGGAVRAPVPVVTGANGQYVPMCKGNDIRENYNSNSYDDINLSCGSYNPENVKYGLPVNANFGKCRERKDMANYNENIFTQVIEPNVFFRTQVLEQASSNAGISYTQQFEPTSQETDGINTMFTEHDPYSVEKITLPPTPNNEVTLDSMYDPRLTGYGPSDRSYLDPITNSRRYLYDDINAIRMPNYITRNKIDVMSFGDKYGPLPANDIDGNPNTCNMHQIANETFLNWSGQQRLELQERLMRKNNAIAWQRKMMPIRTTASGGMSRAGFSRIG